MKLVTAIVRPEMCQAVKDALKAAGHCGMTISHVYGRGQQAGLRFTSRAGDMVVDEIEKTKLEIVLEDGEVDAAVDAIVDVAWTGRPGDGVVFVTPIERFMRIRESHKAAEAPEEPAERGRFPENLLPGPRGRAFRFFSGRGDPGPESECEESGGSEGSV